MSTVNRESACFTNKSIIRAQWHKLQLETQIEGAILNKETLHLLLAWLSYSLWTMDE